MLQRLLTLTSMPPSQKLRAPQSAHAAVSQMSTKSQSATVLNSHQRLNPTGITVRTQATFKIAVGSTILSDGAVKIAVYVRNGTRLTLGQNKSHPAKKHHPLAVWCRKNIVLHATTKSGKPKPGGHRTTRTGLCTSRKTHASERRRPP